MARNRRRPAYGEGDWFAVPLRDHGYAVGIIARQNRDGILFGYFFGPRRDGVPPLTELGGYQPGDAILLARFGDLGLLNGEWTLIGGLPGWSRSAWPMPPFARIDSIDKAIAYKTIYSDDDPGVDLSETVCDPTEAICYPQDSLSGYGAIEIRLTKLITDG
jgi:Immunity protein 26